MNKLTHTNIKGEAQMVDVGDKSVTNRMAIASGTIFMQKETLQLIKNNQIQKGDVLSTARIAGIMAAKKCADLIPMCHLLSLNKIAITFSISNESILITATTKCSGKTGVEIEAITAVSIAAITIYDMCKAVDRFMKITNIQLIKKTGGKSGSWQLNN